MFLTFGGEQDINLFVAETNLTDEIQLHECYMDPLLPPVLRHGRRMLLLLPGESCAQNEVFSPSRWEAEEL